LALLALCAAILLPTRDIVSAKRISVTDESITEPTTRVKLHGAAPDRFRACEESETP